MAAGVVEMLSASERRAVERLAAEAVTGVEAMAAAIVSNYLILMRDAPAALPADPMRGLSVSAKNRRGAV